MVRFYEGYKISFIKAFSYCNWKGGLASPELWYFGAFCLCLCEYSMKDFRRCVKQMKMQRWMRYGNCEPRTMRWSVEPLCPTHNVQRRWEPVYNSGNPHHNTRTVIFLQGNYYFKHVPTTCNHFVTAETENAFPPCTVTCILAKN